MHIRTHLAILAGVTIAAAALIPAAAELPEKDKVTICHATGNPGHWVKQNVAVDSIQRKSGHAFHQDGRDIIPPHNPAGDLPDFPGLNWNDAGKAIWKNDCATPEPVPSPTPTEPTLEPTEDPTSDPTDTPTGDPTEPTTPEPTPTVDPTRSCELPDIGQDYECQPAPSQEPPTADPRDPTPLPTPDRPMPTPWYPADPSAAPTHSQSMSATHTAKPEPTEPRRVVVGLPAAGVNR